MIWRSRTRWDVTTKEDEAYLRRQRLRYVVDHLLMLAAGVVIGALLF